MLGHVLRIPADGTSEEAVLDFAAINGPKLHIDAESVEISLAFRGIDRAVGESHSQSSRDP